MSINKSRQIAGYTRVSTERQAQAHTIESQRAAIQARIAQDGDTLLPGWLFTDDGYSGDVLERPALEALRDKAAAGEIDRLYIHSPDRLARRYAYQVLLLEELRRGGVEVIFLNHQPAQSPEGELLLQVQGVIAEYERAKIMERCRRGRRQHALQGDVAVFGGAPFGYVYIERSKNNNASWRIDAAASQRVQSIYHWFVRDGLSIAGIARRLNHQQAPTSRGKTRWGPSSIWKILRNPAYMGKARFGRTRVGKKTPRLRPVKGGASRPRPALHPTAPEDQIEIAVPAIIPQDLFALAREKLEANRRRRTGAAAPRHLLQGLVACEACGRALVHHRCGGSDGKQYAYYKCTGTDAHRFGGTRMCRLRAIRAELLETAVWQDVTALLTDPARLRHQFEQRLRHAQEDPEQAALTGQLMARQEQGLARLIDAYSEGLITKEEFEARSTRARERLKNLQAEIQATREQNAAQAALETACESFEKFAQKMNAGLAHEDFATRREVLRLLLKEIIVSHEEIRITYKIPPGSAESAPTDRILHFQPPRQGAVVGNRFHKN